MWDLTIHPLGDPTSSLAHRPVSGSDIICNIPNPPLADIVPFELSLNVFKMHLLGRGFHTLMRNVSFPSPTDVSHTTPPPRSPNLLQNSLFSLQQQHLNINKERKLPPNTFLILKGRMEKHLLHYQRTFVLGPTDIKGLKGRRPNRASI